MKIHFSSLLGNEEVKRGLDRMISTDRISHSLLFTGIDGVGKSLFAKLLAQTLIGTDRVDHPDLHIYRPEGRAAMHSIDSMRAFSSEVYTYPNESKKKVFIIEEADRMLPTSANALLKTFEEPARATYIILLTSTKQNLLPTILSRCQTIYFKPLSEESIAQYLQTLGYELEKVKNISKRSLGSISRALSLLKEPCIQTLILDALAKGKLASYRELLALVDSLDSAFSSLRESFLSTISKEAAELELFTPLQKEIYEKEIEGQVALYILEQFHLFFEDILSWYRDLEVLRCAGTPALLLHKEYEQDLFQALQRAESCSFDRATTAIKEAKMQISRFSSIKSSLEALFLKLNLF